MTCVRKTVIATGDYVQELGRWVCIFQGGFFTVAVFQKRPGFEHSMSVTSEFAQSPELLDMAWAALMEDLSNLARTKELCKVHFCRVYLTHEKERIKIQF